MGLGKTVTALALIAANPRTEENGGPTTDISRSRKARIIAVWALTSQIMDTMSLIDRPKPTGATLIVCPLSILQQWEDEIAVHAPSFKVVKYEGASNDWVSDCLFRCVFDSSGGQKVCGNVSHGRNCSNDLQCPAEGYSPSRYTLFQSSPWYFLLSSTNSLVQESNGGVSCLTRRRLI